MIFNMVFGSGSGGSSFNVCVNVVGGTTAPASPDKNTIWVNTDVTVDHWAFSATDPDYLGTTGVWIKTGTGSPIAFNILDSETCRAYIYPIGAKRWDASTSSWIDLQAKLWDGTKWVDLIYYLFNAGDVCNGLTGGWEAYALPRSLDGTGDEPNISIRDGVMQLVGNIHTGGIVRTVNKISFSGVETVELDAAINTYYHDGDTGDGTDYSQMMCFNLWSSIGETYEVNRVYTQGIATEVLDGVKTFDVSGVPDGEYYVGFSFYSTDATGTTPAITLRTLKLNY